MYEFSCCSQLMAEIQRTFADTADKRMKNVVPEVMHSDWEAGEIQAAFTNKAWPEITLDFLIQNEGYMWFLSQEVLYLFLPAFMLESLTSEGIYSIAPALVRIFSPRPDGQIIEGEEIPLNREQCCALYHYVEFLANEFADVFDDIQHRQNTLKYWKRQCGVILIDPETT